MTNAKGNQGSDPYYDDYYYQQSQSQVKESQQKSIMIFLANTDNVVQKSHLLRALNNKVFTLRCMCMCVTCALHVLCGRERSSAVPV